MTVSENNWHSFNILPNKNVKKVIQYDLNMVKIKEFSSITLAGEQLKLYIQSIWRCCKFQQIQSGGFIFRYAEDDGILTKPIVLKNDDVLPHSVSRKITQYE